MPVGVSRLYVDTEGRPNMAAYMRAMREGRSFVTTGPMLLLEVDGVAKAVAARVMSVAQGGQTLATAATVRALPLDEAPTA